MDSLTFAAEAASCGGIAATGVLMLRGKTPIHSALWLIACFLCTGVLYVVQGSVFLGFMQVLTYAGAILVLVLFTLMLMDLREDQGPPLRSFGLRVMSGASFAASLALLLRWMAENPAADFPALSEGWGGMHHIGDLLFRPAGIFPFEYATLLLLSTLVGCVQIAKRKRS
ncbi:MAG: NADH-quinone oxidoreductase subunit J [Planctomycetota bacterium]